MPLCHFFDHKSQHQSVNYLTRDWYPISNLDLDLLISTSARASQDRVMLGRTPSPAQTAYIRRKFMTQSRLLPRFMRCLFSCYSYPLHLHFMHVHECKCNLSVHPRYDASIYPSSTFSAVDAAYKLQDERRTAPSCRPIHTQ